MYSNYVCSSPNARLVNHCFTTRRPDPYGSYCRGRRAILLMICRSLLFHDLHHPLTIVSRLVRVVRVVLSHSRVVSVRQYLTRMIKCAVNMIQSKCVCENICFLVDDPTIKLPRLSLRKTHELQPWHHIELQCSPHHTAVFSTPHCSVLHTIVHSNAGWPGFTISY